MSRFRRYLLQAFHGPSTPPRTGPEQVRNPAEKPVGLRHAIDEFAFFKGNLHIAGWIHSPEAAVRLLAIEMPDETLYPIRNMSLASPDVAAMLGPGAAAARFDEVLPVPAPIVMVAQAKLLVGLAERQSVRIADLGTIWSDPAQSLVARFQDMIHRHEAGELLEVGSRARSGVVRRGLTPPGWNYTGLDILDGPNVDVVGDAHDLRTLFPERRFDAAMSFSVLEHMLMPWKFVIELNRVLNTGAIGVFTTHQCWPLHDEPWDFWRFSDRAWAGLFNAATGFEIIDVQLGEPCYVVAAKCHKAVAFEDIPQGRLASAVLFRKTGETALEWPVCLDQVISTSYPASMTVS